MTSNQNYPLQLLKFLFCDIWSKFIIHVVASVLVLCNIWILPSNLMLEHTSMTFQIVCSAWSERRFYHSPFIQMAFASVLVPFLALFNTNHIVHGRLKPWIFYIGSSTNMTVHTPNSFQRFFHISDSFIVIYIKIK